MNKTLRNTVVCLVITLIAVMPLRAVMALGQSDCQMHDLSPQQAAAHHVHADHAVLDKDQHSVVTVDDCCCCDSSMSCNSDCGVGVLAAAIMHTPFTVPAINKSSFRTRFENTLVFRELIPLTRPPAYL